MQRDSTRVNSSRWYDIQTKARSKEVKEREGPERQTASAQKKEEKNHTKKLYIYRHQNLPVRLQTTAVSSARLSLQGPHVCMHAYISQMTIATINTRGEQNTPTTTASHCTPDSQGHGSQDEI